MTQASEPGPAHWRLYVLIGVMTFLWSVNFVIAKIALREFPALLVAAMRTGLAGILILPIYFRQETNGKPLWTWRDAPMLLMLGVLGVALNQVFFVQGIGHTTVAHAAIIIGLSPILVVLLAFASGQERLRAGKVLGMVLALTGVIILQTTRTTANHGSSSWLGDVFIFLAALSFALFTVLGKPVAGRYSSVTLNTFAYVAGGALLLPVVLWNLSSFPFAKVSWVAWTSIVYMAVFPSVLCYLIYYYALARIPASRVSAFSYLQPLSATLMAIPVLGEQPTASLGVGGALVLLGVLVTERL